MKYRFILFFFFYSLISSAQSPPSDLTTNFAFAVKSIDDFIERFDFVRGTEFEKFFRTNYPNQELTRHKLVLSLFNFKNKSFSQNPDVTNFIDEVTDSIHPAFINFSDSSWYAEAECKVIYRSKPQTLTLILKVDRDKNDAVKWSIVSAHAKFLGVHASPGDSLSFMLNNEYMRNRASDQSRYFLHPVSHALDFMNIDKLFSRQKDVFEKYVYDGPRSYQLNNLIKIVKTSELKFEQVNTISYHFLQVSGWIAIVDYFNREERNSGWLINTLFKATDEQKRIYLNNHLNVRTD